MTILPSRTPNRDEVLTQGDEPNPHSSSLITTSPTSTMDNSTCLSVSDTDEEASLQATRPLQASPGTQLFNIPWLQADETLHIFQQKFVHHFPFVVLENGISARQLEQRQPFTLKAIMIIATPLPWLITAVMRDSFFAHLGQHLFTEKDFDLDILQCILLCIAWYASTVLSMANMKLTGLGLIYAI